VPALFLNEIRCLFLDHKNTEHHLRIHPRPNAQYSRAAPVAHRFCVGGYCAMASAGAESVGKRGNYRMGKFAIRRFFRGPTWSPESSIISHHIPQLAWMRQVVAAAFVTSIIPPELIPYLLQRI